AEELQVADYRLGSPRPAGNPDPGSLAFDWRQAELLETAAWTKVEAGNRTATSLHRARGNNHDLELYGSHRLCLTGVDFHPGDNERARKGKLQDKINIVVWILQLNIGGWIAVEQDSEWKLLGSVLACGREKFCLIQGGDNE